MVLAFPVRYEARGSSAVLDARGTATGRRSDRQHFADRLNPMRMFVVVDELSHHMGRRSSEA